jgi:phage N-6-adenine-methyltransferase
MSDYSLFTDVLTDANHGALPPTIIPFNEDPDAREIGELYRLGRQSMADSVRHMVEAGRRLLEKKESVGHGNWLPWLEANKEVLGFENRRTASRLMEAATKWDVNAPFDEAEARRLNRTIWGNAVRGTAGTGENEWYTPGEYIELVRQVLGVIDLDPATSLAAQEVVQARNFYTEQENGLNHEWHGRVWLNPPYSQPLIGQFICKLLEEWRDGHVMQAILLTHNHTDTPWFHEVAENMTGCCFTRGRVQFYGGGEIAKPTQGQVFSYFGQHVERFEEVFGPFGTCLRPSRNYEGRPCP